jgi:uncharacterized protein (DUF433 family)
MTLVREMLGDELYEYYPLGEYVVIAPGVCGGRPTFKGTRFEVQVVMDLLAAGWSVDRILREYRRTGITRQAIGEAVHLAEEALRSQAEALAA